MSDTIIVPRTGQAPLRVRGQEISSHASSWNKSDPSYSGAAGREQTARVIKTAGGKYVVAVENRTQWQGEHDTCNAAVFPSLKEVMEYLRQHVPTWMVDDFIDDFGAEAVAEDVE